jgi:hypothetical protein
MMITKNENETDYTPLTDEPLAIWEKIDSWYEYEEDEEDEDEQDFE